MSEFPTDENASAFIAQLRAAGKTGSATNATQALNRLRRLLVERRPDATPTNANRDDIAAYTRTLDAVRPSTRIGYLRQIRDFYRWIGNNLADHVPVRVRTPALHVDAPEDQTVADYLLYIRSEGRDSTAEAVANVLATYRRLLHRERPGATPSTATAADLMAYRIAVTTSAASRTANAFGLGTQVRHLATVRGYHGWLRRRGLSMLNAADYLPMPRDNQRTVRKDFLSTQEAQALLDTAAALVEREESGSRSWAKAMRTFAAVALAIASGRRRAGLCALRLADLDLERGEMRVEREKGRAGRVLPVADWAIAITRVYVEQARPVLLRGCRGGDVAVSDSLLIGAPGKPYTDAAYRRHLQTLVAETRTANTDLVDLARKDITTHSLRVTMATLLFANGCPIRSINEIMLHRKLSTTAAYTPIATEDLRRALIAAHPRA